MTGDGVKEEKKGRGDGVGKLESHGRIGFPFLTFSLLFPFPFSLLRSSSFPSFSESRVQSTTSVSSDFVLVLLQDTGYAIKV